MQSVVSITAFFIYTPSNKSKVSDSAPGAKKGGKDRGTHFKGEGGGRGSLSLSLNPNEKEVMTQGTVRLLMAHGAMSDTTNRGRGYFQSVFK